jgi:bifunctional UDP-N-acetylglucosamine pyrophosphorylase/glucosamine-1-phosphate N-acetyltransferase
VAALETDADEVLGVNTRNELAAVEQVFQARARSAAMLAGATLVAPETVFFSHDTILGRDVVIEPNVFFAPGVTVADGVTIRAFSHIEGAKIAMGAVVGPYARLRPGADIGPKAHIGNFVEIKNASIDAGAKVNHLTYIGDAHVGAGSNIGAGTITCNNDGYGKYHTEIGANVFVGSDSALVAPVTIGDGAYIGSGSVITEDVPADALAIARGRQVVKPGWAAALRAKRAGTAKASGLRDRRGGPPPIHH